MTARRMAHERKDVSRPLWLKGMNLPQLDQSRGVRLDARGSDAGPLNADADRSVGAGDAMPMGRK